MRCAFWGMSLKKMPAQVAKRADIRSVTNA
jgi:hypothetical protein